jgi:NADH-quinone oxidoreductase subunit M
VTELRLPWILIVTLLPFLGFLLTLRQRDSEVARRQSIAVCSVTFIAALCMWLDYWLLDVSEAVDAWRPLAGLVGQEGFAIDAINAPLLPLAALLNLAVAMSTLRTKVRRFSFSGMHLSEAILMATLSCQNASALIVLLAVGPLPRYLELRDRGKPTRVFGLHMGLFVLLIATGWSLTGSHSGSMFNVGIFLLMAGVLLRSGSVPVHAWMTDLFEHASFGTALLFVTPMVGAYAAVRLVLPIAPDWALRSIAIASLVTSVYAAGMALVQKEVRRFFCYLLLSHSSLILVGLETATPVGLTGSLVLWLSDSLALAGFGLTLRSLESRVGRLSLANYHGLYEHTPTLAVFFLITGLTSIGFPGAFGFIGMELLVSGAVATDPFVGSIVVLAGALNGIAVIAAYFRLFTGVHHATSVPLVMRRAERIAVLSIATLIIASGAYPQPTIQSRYEAARLIVESRKSLIHSDSDGRRPIRPSPSSISERVGAMPSGVPHPPALPGDDRSRPPVNAAGLPIAPSRSAR